MRTPGWRGQRTPAKVARIEPRLFGITPVTRDDLGAGRRTGEKRRRACAQLGIDVREIDAGVVRDAVGRRAADHAGPGAAARMKHRRTRRRIAPHPGTARSRLRDHAALPDVAPLLHALDAGAVIALRDDRAALAAE